MLPLSENYSSPNSSMANVTLGRRLLRRSLVMNLLLIRLPYMTMASIRTKSIIHPTNFATMDRPSVSTWRRPLRRLSNRNFIQRTYKPRYRPCQRRRNVLSSRITLHRTRQVHSLAAAGQMRSLRQLTCHTHFRQSCILRPRTLTTVHSRTSRRHCSPRPRRRMHRNPTKSNQSSSFRSFRDRGKSMLTPLSDCRIKSLRITCSPIRHPMTFENCFRFNLLVCRRGVKDVPVTCDAHVIRQEVSRTNGTYEGFGWVYVQIRITISFVVSDFHVAKVWSNVGNFADGIHMKGRKGFKGPTATLFSITLVKRGRMFHACRANI